MEKVKMSKSLRKLVKKSSDKFVRDLYFRPKRRNELRESFVKAQDEFIKTLETPLGSSPTIDQAKDRYWADVFSDQMSRMIDLIDNIVPKRLKEMELVHTYFKLFKKPTSKFLAIECIYDKGIPKKHYITHLIIPSGFPRKGAQTKARMVRVKYDLKGFEQMDGGIFTQKYLSFIKIHLKFKGKNGSFKFELTPRGKAINNSWLRVI